MTPPGEDWLLAGETCTTLFWFTKKSSLFGITASELDSEGCIVSLQRGHIGFLFFFFFYKDNVICFFCIIATWKQTCLPEVSQTEQEPNSVFAPVHLAHIQMRLYVDIQKAGGLPHIYTDYCHDKVSYMSFSRAVTGKIVCIALKVSRNCETLENCASQSVHSHIHGDQSSWWSQQLCFWRDNSHVQLSVLY